MNCDRFVGVENARFPRRRFLRTAALALATSQLGTTTEGGAHTGASAPAASAVPGSHTSFDAMKQIDAGVLNNGYAEVGPARGAVVILLHGWPYDIHSFIDVAPALAARGYRVIVPYVRGCGKNAYLKLVYYKRHDVGGHFAAWEQPQLFCEDVRATFWSAR